MTKEKLFEQTLNEFGGVIASLMVSKLVMDNMNRRREEEYERMRKRRSEEQGYNQQRRDERKAAPKKYPWGNSETPIYIFRCKSCGTKVPCFYSPVRMRGLHCKKCCEEQNIKYRHPDQQFKDLITFGRTGKPKLKASAEE